jgi:hypothetical protein
MLGEQRRMQGEQMRGSVEGRPQVAFHVGGF